MEKSTFLANLVGKTADSSTPLRSGRNDTFYARFRSGISGDRHSERSEESLYFSRSTVDTTGKIQGSVRSAQDDGHFNDYTFAGNALA